MKCQCLRCTVNMMVEEVSRYNVEGFFFNLDLAFPSFAFFLFIQTLMLPSLVTRLTRRVPLVKQELLTLPEHMSSPPVISGVRVTRSLVLCVCFVDRCLFFCYFSFGHCVVWTSKYGFSLPLKLFYQKQ